MRLLLFSLLVCAALPACATCSDRGAAPDASPVPEAAAPRARTPSEIRKEGNHLVGASSAYLLEHAHNPVDWHPWGQEALDLAKNLDRPIFLSIGYASCHWCHVMEREVFDKDDVAELLNARFVAIKVDREERPDLDAIYMDSVLAIAGDGGWPLSAFLTPKLDAFFGATYLPHDRFLRAAKDAADRFTRERATVESKAAEIARRIAQSAADPVDRARVRPQEIALLAKAAAESSDPKWGGWGTRAKFPSPTKLSLLLHAYRKWGDTDVGRALQRTLDAMASGGLYDHVGGGFHRYAVDAAWLVPHFEKMLYTNALLASVYLEASAAFGEPRYLEVAKDTLDFLLRDMVTAEGAFAASLDADSGGSEGTYYCFSPAEIRAVAPGQEGQALVASLGATDAGNFQGSNVLTRRAERFDAALFAKHRQALRDARDARPKPRRDSKIVAAWNGLAISALARAFAVTGDARYRAAAERAATFVASRHRAADGTLARASTGGVTSGPGALDDYAALALGLAALYSATGDTSRLAAAIALVEQMHARMAAPDGGLYSSETRSPRPPRLDLGDQEAPSGGALALDADARLAALTGRPGLDDRTEQLLDALGGEARGLGLGASAWLDAALLRSGPFYEVVVAGDGEAAARLSAEASKVGAAWSVLASVPAAGADPPALALLPSLQGKVAAKDGRPLAYVCLRGTCKLPAREPADLAAQLRAGWLK